jgi:hypothetical protein
MEKFQVDDVVEVVNIKRLIKIEAENWLLVDFPNVKVGDRFRVEQVRSTGWIVLSGGMYWNPPEKFKKINHE